MTTEQSPTIGKLAEALSKAQAVIENAKRDSQNPFFKSSYADLASVRQACQAGLCGYGLAVAQTCEVTEGGVIVATTLMHSSGEWIRGRLKVTPGKNDPQSIGSAITYARRYSLASIVGVATEDDDGEAAHGRTHGEQEKPKTPAPRESAPPAKPADAYPRRPMPQAEQSQGVTVQTVKEKSGTSKAGKPWTVFFIKFSDNTEVATFDSKMGEFAATAAQLGTPVVYSKKQSLKDAAKYDLVSIENAPAEAKATTETDDIPF